MKTVLLSALAVAAVVASCDPVHSDEIDSLGGEDPGVRRGPLHRPGQPCQVCHDGSLGSPSKFSVAGTIVQSEGQTPGQNTGASGIYVVMTDANGAVYTTQTNAAGNFYVTPDVFDPHYPMKVVLSDGRRNVQAMWSQVGRDGSCAECHNRHGASPTSTGPIFVQGTAP